MSVNNLSAYFGQSHDGVFLINEFMELLYANGTMQEWVGVTTQAKQHYNMLDMIALGDSRSVFLHNSKTALAGTPAKFQCMVQPLQNEPIWLEISLQRAPYGKTAGHCA